MNGVVVVGGGPAGASLALTLARAGREVTVIERDAAPSHKVCGEFIGGDGLARLAALGIDVAALGAQPITAIRMVRGIRSVESRLPFSAVGLSRQTLDAALLAAAVAAGATILRGHAVRAVHGTALEVDGLGSIVAETLVLATGKHDLRGARRRLARPAADNVGFKLHLTLAPAQRRALDAAIELLLFRDTYAGLQPIGADLANLCLVTPRARLATAGGWPGLLDDLCRECPHLARRLDGAAGWPKPLAIARVPYGFVHADDAPGESGFRLGDQMGVIHSFTGDGIAIALHTARLASEALLSGRTAHDYHRAARGAIRGPIRLASALYRAGRSPAGQAAMLAAARIWPPALARVATLTRAG